MPLYRPATEGIEIIETIEVGDGPELDTQSWGSVGALGWPSDPGFSGLGAEIAEEFLGNPVITLINMTMPRKGNYWSVEFENLFPEELAETPSLAAFTPIDIPGRSSPPQSYNGGEPRSLSFTLSLHRDLMGKGIYLNQDINPANLQSVLQGWKTFLYQMQAMNYPVYTETGVNPPRAYLKIGNNIRIRGIPQVTLSYKRPISYKMYSACDISFTLTEIVDMAWSAAEVIEGYGRYAYWHDDKWGGLR